MSSIFSYSSIPTSHPLDIRGVEMWKKRLESDAIKPNIKHSRSGRKKWYGFIVTGPGFLEMCHQFFSMHILSCEYILISVVWSWRCLDSRTAGLGSRGWRLLFKYLCREEDKV